MNDFLQRGSRGPLVRELQRALKDYFYYVGEVDGIYGPLTEEAVIAFQQDAGIGVDGIVGPETRAALQEELGRTIGGPTQVPGLPPIPDPYPSPFPGPPTDPGGSSPGGPSPGGPSPGGGQPEQGAGLSTTAVGIAAAIAAAGIVLPRIMSGPSDE